MVELFTAAARRGSRLGQVSFFVESRSGGMTVRLANHNCVQPATAILVTVAGCVFDSNEAVEGGGDISAYEHSRIKVTGATFTRSVGGYGGSMMFINASAILVNTTILAAMATTGSGGAISLGGNASVTMISSLVSTCRSFTGGGGVTVFDGARFELHRSTFANNTALPADITAAQINVCTTYGGGISAWGVAKVELQSSQLLNNRASCGGAVATKENATVLLQRGPGTLLVRLCCCHLVGCC